MIVAVAVGSNLGPREDHLAFARGRLNDLFENLRVSTARETAPENVPGPQPPFLNAAAIGETTRPAHEVLAALLAIEQERERLRPFPNAPRTLDLDLILYGDCTIADDRLVVPHPRFRERRFVLEPLAEIAPDLRDPLTGKTMAELWDELRRAR